ncbi:MAG: DMT family transporter, partial [Bauldia sp.]|nr:DMT family transporter [Bauldia sp.]
FLDPMFVTAARAAISGLAGLGVLVFLRRPIPRGHGGAFATLTLCLVLGFPALSTVALTTVPSAHGGVILALLPLATAAAAVVFAGERPSPAFWFFAVVGSAIVLVFALRDSQVAVVAGDIYLVLSVVAAAIGYAISGRLARIMPGWEVITWVVVCGLPFALPAMVWLWPRDAASVPLSAWLGVLYISLMAQYAGFWAWNAALAIGGVARVGQIQLLQPFVTFVLAALFLGETIDGEMIGFALAVVVVVALGRRAAIGQRASAGG